jgi:hypothetical protein
VACSSSGTLGHNWFLSSFFRDIYRGSGSTFRVDHATIGCGLFPRNEPNRARARKRIGRMRKTDALGCYVQPWTIDLKAGKQLAI